MMVLVSSHTILEITNYIFSIRQRKKYYRLLIKANNKLLLRRVPMTDTIHLLTAFDGTGNNRGINWN
jgi:hypothetical protein